MQPPRGARGGDQKSGAGSLPPTTGDPTTDSPLLIDKPAVSAAARHHDTRIEQDHRAGRFTAAVQGREESLLAAGDFGCLLSGMREKVALGRRDNGKIIGHPGCVDLQAKGAVQAESQVADPLRRGRARPGWRACPRSWPQPAASRTWSASDWSACAWGWSRRTRLAGWSRPSARWPITWRDYKQALIDRGNTAKQHARCSTTASSIWQGRSGRR